VRECAPAPGEQPRRPEPHLDIEVRVDGKAAPGDLVGALASLCLSRARKKFEKAAETNAHPRTAEDVNL
jgi:hypothetical protein